MRNYKEKRGKFEISCYTVEINETMRKQALKFAKDIILSDNQYSRMLPSELLQSKDLKEKEKIEIQRTYMGKLGELAFLKLLEEKGKSVDTTDMLKVYEGQNNVDSYDFITSDNLKVDIKTGFRFNHMRLLVNKDQFDKNPKDFYVAVKISAKDTDISRKLVDWYNISEAHVLGYAEYNYIKEKCSERDFGEGLAKNMFYNKLLGIDKLISMFPSNQES